MMWQSYDAATRPWQESEQDTLTELATSYQLVVWNDEVNTFEWVIETLIRVCGHTEEQAEQCALLTFLPGSGSCIITLPHHAANLIPIQFTGKKVQGF
ncbi:MAG: ATP-dependent Clp protease adaptor ClpS, partial [Bacteroidota bacterium]|nr:ATP-dependent Clp protease adaptor ClpS [Bacteroidota bacterium]